MLRGMSYDITHVETQACDLTISVQNLSRAREMDLPHFNPLWGIHEPGSAPDSNGNFTITRFRWSGPGSGRAYEKSFSDFVGLLEGKAHLVLFWNGGAEVEGVKIQEGRAYNVPAQIILDEIGPTDPPQPGAA